MVSPRNRFLSPTYEGQRSYKQGSKSTPRYWLGPLPSQHLLELLWVPGHNDVPGNDIYLFCYNDGPLLYISTYVG